jgi:GNAT superfamily N-acetyltransferase
MSESLLIREAREDDAVEFSQAYEASWNAAMEPLIETSLGDLVSFEDRVTSYRKSLSAAGPEARVWVAVRGVAIVGLAVCRVDERVGELQSLYVIPAEWGSGAGGRLHDAALDGMRALGAREATLWVVEANTRARRFYEREGWESDGETKQTKLSDLDVTELRYRRVL